MALRKKKYSKICQIYLIAFAAGLIFSTGCGGFLDVLFYDPNVYVDPGSFTFEAIEGGENPPPQNLNVDCSYMGEYYSFSEDCSVDDIWTDQDWLHVNKSETYGNEDVQVSVDITGLTAGTYNGSILLRSWAPLFEEDENIPVTLIINQPEAATDESEEPTDESEEPPEEIE